MTLPAPTKTKKVSLVAHRHSSARARRAEYDDAFAARVKKSKKKREGKKDADKKVQQYPAPCNKSKLLLMAL